MLGATKLNWIRFGLVTQRFYQHGASKLQAHTHVVLESLGEVLRSRG